MEETETDVAEVEPSSFQLPSTALLIGAGIVLALSLGALVYIKRMPPCPCQEHTTGEEPLTQVAKASAELKEEPGE